MAAVERTLQQRRRGNQPAEISTVAEQIGHSEAAVRQVVAILVQRGLVYATDSHIMLLS